MIENDFNIDLKRLESTLGFSFKDQNIIFEALTHKSYSNEQNHHSNYERLEFLGDAVLQLIVTEYLLGKYKNYDEGVLSKLRGHFVSEKFLSTIAKELHLGEYILLGKGEIANGGKRKSSLLCDIFESIVAAIYLDSGFEDAKKVLLRIFGGKIDEDISKNSFIDPKSELQIYTQRNLGTLPEYIVIDESGPEHDKTFTIELQLAGKTIAMGNGKSKKAAEKDAAEKALISLNNE